MKPVLAISLLLAWILPTSVRAVTTVDLNIVPSSRAPFGAAQNWVRATAELKSVRVRSSLAAAQPEIHRRGTTLYVTGVIDSRNKLVVPGRSFTISQQAAIQAWLDEQRKGESVGAATSRDRFGLTTKQLNELQETFKLTVTEPTKDQQALKFVQSSMRRIGLDLRLSELSRTLLNESVIRDEWQGYTAGTAIAAALRPSELIMVPKTNAAGRVDLWVLTDTAAPEGWPVGWKSELKNRELVPKIYDPLPLDITNTPIADVMAAISARLETPVMYDRALLELLQIDPAKATVSVNSPRTIYLRAISQTLFQAQLKHEIRVDERGKPFFWVTPRRLPKTDK